MLIRHVLLRIGINCSLFESLPITWIQLFGELLQTTGIDPLKKMTEQGEQAVIGNIERWLYDDDPNYICDMPNNLTEERKRMLDDIDIWLRESSTYSHFDPFAQAQAELLPSCRETKVPQLDSANNITSHPIRPAKQKDRHKKRKRCDFCPEFITLSNISRHMHLHVYCNHCEKVHYSKSQQNLMYECPLFVQFWNATYISLRRCQFQSWSMYVCSV